MSDSLEKLVKEIDALTYNARSVMNALNRSVIANSSTNGFTITRAGVSLKLTRPLIYRLYRFYEEWKNNEFYSGTSLTDTTIDSSGRKPFTLIKQEHDAVPLQQDDTLPPIDPNGATTEALVVHSKILFLTADNSSGNNDFWLGLIQSAHNPKLITNSAPIPLNLRTPIFDENLSTTRFLSHESYLFPYAYFALDTFGYSGDVTAHQLAGLSWEIITDDYIRLISNKVSIGGMIPDAFFKTFANRVGNYALAWGYDTTARGDYSTAGGLHTMAVSYGSIAIGDTSIASGVYAIALGYVNSAPGAISAVVGGTLNTSIANYSGVFVGQGNITGSPKFSWKFNISTHDVCAIDPNTNLPIIKTVTDAINKNLLILSGNHISEFNQNDIIRLFDFTTAISPSDTSIHFSFINGNGYPSIEATIQGITYNPIDDTTSITIGLPGVIYEGVDGGFLSVTYISATSQSPGTNSFATGLNNIASGESQTVVGKFNKQSSDARFIVGTGTGDGTSRKNSFLVGDDYISGFVTSDDNIDSDNSFGFKLDPTRSIIRRGRSKIEINDTTSQINLYQANVVPAGNESVMLFDTGKIVIYAQKEVQLTSETKLTLTSLVDTIINTAGILTITSGSTVTTTGVLTLNWSSLSLNGPTFGSLPTTDKQYSHIVSPSNPNISTTLSFIQPTGFYAVDQASPDFDSLKTIPLTDIGAQNSKFWLLNITHDEPANLTDARRYESWQLIFGRQFGASPLTGGSPNDPLDTNNIAPHGDTRTLDNNGQPISGHGTTGHIMVRRTFNGDDILGSGGRYTEWRKLAWLEDVNQAVAGILPTITNNPTPATIANLQTANFNITGTGSMGIAEISTLLTAASAVINFTLNVTGSTTTGTLSVGGNASIGGDLILSSPGKGIKLKSSNNTLNAVANTSGSTPPYSSTNPHTFTILTSSVLTTSKITLTLSSIGTLSLSSTDNYKYYIRNIISGVSFDIYIEGFTLAATNRIIQFHWVIVNDSP